MKTQIVVQTRCNPKLNNQLIGRFKEDPRFGKLLTSIGLESLLELKVSRLQRELCADLARKVDVQGVVLKVNCSEIPLTYSSLTKVLGLSCSGLSILIRKDITREEFMSACRRFSLHQ